ncbi:DUF2672 domain-containing protein [Rickettsiaceae bacterium]|nr:DUF2672 domain-containing protein [Rickettsiaceae bacterium]
MSLLELLVVFLVCFLVIKPEDIPKILAKFKEIRSFITNTKKEIISHIDPDVEKKPMDDNMEQMNFYLAKIAKIGIEYEGEYSLKSIKEHYRKIVKDQIKKD